MKKLDNLKKRKIYAPLLCLSYFIAYMFLNIIFFIAAGVFNGGDVVNLAPMLQNLLQAMSMCAAVIIGCVVINYYSKTKITEVISLKKFDWVLPIMLTIFAWGVTELCDNLSGVVLSRFMTVEPNRSIDPDLAGIVSAIIIAPIFEELLFRYTFCETARGAYKIGTVCVFNGLFFALVHGYNIQGYLNVFIGGVLAAYVYCKTRNILYTIAEHAIHNALCLIDYDKINFFGDFIYHEKNGFVLSSWQWIVFNVILVTVPLIWYFKVFGKKYTTDYFAVDRVNGLPVEKTEKNLTEVDLKCTAIQ